VALGAALAQPLASLAAARHLRRWLRFSFSGEVDFCVWVVVTGGGMRWMVVERGARGICSRGLGGGERGDPHDKGCEPLDGGADR
jgi:hypothetical protein